MIWKTTRSLMGLLCATALLCGCAQGQQAVVAAGTSSTDAAFTGTLITQKTTQAFTGEAVKAEDITTILQAGVNAPSAMNAQPWHFSVIQDSALLSEISEAMSLGAAPPTGTPPADRPSGGDANGKPNAPARSEETATAPTESEETAAAPMENEESIPAPVDDTEDRPAVPGASGGKKLSLADATVAVVVSGKASRDTDSFDCGLACDRMSVAAMALGYGVKIVSSPAGGINAAYKERLGILEDMQAVAVLLIGVADTSEDAVSGATTRNAFDEVVTYVE